jgi:lysophospholipase L1-like esterase
MMRIENYKILRCSGRYHPERLLRTILKSDADRDLKNSLLRPISPLFYVILLTLVFACSDHTPRLPKLADDATILAFGDSLTYGSGAPKDESYPAVLQRLSGRQVINAGNPGEVSRDGLTRLSDLLEQTQPDLLVLCHGGNDLLRQYDLNETKSNVQQMVHVAQQQGIAVILLGVPKPKLFLMNSASFYQEIADELKIPLETDIIPTVVSDNNLKSDTIHPNSQGYRMIGEAVHKLLQKTGAL